MMTLFLAVAGTIALGLVTAMAEHGKYERARQYELKEERI